jgi:uncharacterized protein
MNQNNRESNGEMDALFVEEGLTDLPNDFAQRLGQNVKAAGGELETDLDSEGAIGSTMFDLPNSEDDSVTVLLPQDHIERAPSQCLVRIKSRDGRKYLGTVAAGPFAEPDNLRGDSPMLITVSTRGGIYLPSYHGRIQISIIGEEHEDGTLSPPRFRPLPNSRVFTLDDEESARVLCAEGDIALGRAVGFKDVRVGIPSTQKSVLPRHTAVLGTTGGGKSTTVANLITEAQRADTAVIVLDVEGEYTHLHEATEDIKMISLLKEMGREPAGLPKNAMTLYHLVDRETTNPVHPNKRPFSLQFARLSPYAVTEILGLSEAQEERFIKAYDVTKMVMRDLNIFPKRGDEEQERLALEIDEFTRGYPRMTLAMLIDVVVACMVQADKDQKEKDNLVLKSAEFQASDQAIAQIQTRMKSVGVPGNVTSWRALLGRLGRLSRLKVFDTPDNRATPLNYKSLLKPGAVSVLDLSDTGASELSNIVIADLLQGLQDAQDDAYVAFEKAKIKDIDAPLPTRVLLIIEEAHEFLSQERIDKMPILFQQVARIAKRGRKRWLGLMFVTQLPQHLPRQLFGLVNSYILHKITDPQVVSTLQKTVSGIDSNLWNRLPGLAPGQAIVSFPHMTRPLLIAVNPTGAKLRMID